MNVEIGDEAALFPEKEYIMGIFVAVYGVHMMHARPSMQRKVSARGMMMVTEHDTRVSPPPPPPQPRDIVKSIQALCL
jgi:hypothetical protein